MNDLDKMLESISIYQKMVLLNLFRWGHDQIRYSTRKALERKGLTINRSEWGVFSWDGNYLTHQGYLVVLRMLSPDYRDSTLNYYLFKRYLDEQARRERMQLYRRERVLL